MIDFLIDGATTLVGSLLALYIIRQPHPVLSAIALVSLAAVTALRWCSWGAYFFALLLLLIYLGAALVLFLFVVMTLSQKYNLTETFCSYKSAKFYSVISGSLFLALYEYYQDSPRHKILSLSTEDILSSIAARSEVLMQFLGFFLLLALLVSVVMLKGNKKVLQGEL